MPKSNNVYLILFTYKFLVDNCCQSSVKGVSYYTSSTQNPAVQFKYMVLHIGTKSVKA